MPAAIDKELVAIILLEAIYSTDELAAKKYDVSIRSICRWRKQLVTDEELARIVGTKKAAFDAAWADELPNALKEGIQFIRAAANAAKTDAKALCNPDMVHAVAGAIRLCAEVLYTGKMIDARLAGQNRPPSEIPGQVFGQSLATERTQ